MGTRRQLLVLGGAAGLWVGAFRYGPDIVERFRGIGFEPHERVSGYRRIASEGARSAGAGFDVLTGLGRSEPLPPGLAEKVASDPESALFDTPANGPTRIAYFFDYYCPYCRVLSEHLASLRATAEIAVTRHHWPIFGASSDLAARAVLAAGMQTDDDALHARLMQTPIRVTPSYLEELALAVGLSWPELERDMQAQEVEASLQRTRALVRLFGFVGTPALVVGRTVVEGEIPEARLLELARIERPEGGAGPAS
ncbi:DSBA-like thioredoxin domain-containing protein [Palleronia aestuarii]|uniref:DSBA-like thioredoxin domain-containing protein n=1 Tax=Palleronia aestuarii TaxID=568105 RepID=A0A2W7NUH9_9RHOB|nr:DsbA family protein [Palleronia aestuarii]PZX14892.1 DSBA-like thioredoxin domain-containing protein [Palleronia aestuarii]